MNSTEAIRAMLNGQTARNAREETFYRWNHRTQTFQGLYPGPNALWRDCYFGGHADHGDWTVEERPQPSSGCVRCALTKTRFSKLQQSLEAVVDSMVEVLDNIRFYGKGSV